MKPTKSRNNLIYQATFHTRSKNTIHAHLPECMDVETGDHVLTAECRPISKSVSYVVVEVKA